MNGGLIGFGLGFIAASFALYQVINDYIPAFAATWQFRGVAIVGGLGLLFGIGFEMYERMKLKKEAADEQAEDQPE